MFTVIFAEKETIKLFEETKVFFGPLYNLEQVVFCEWDKDADDFDSMASRLYDLIEYQNDWRALILYDDGLEKLNPFDYTMYSEPYYSKAVKDWDYYQNRRTQRFLAYEKAISNPLVKLTTALCGMPNYKSVIEDEEYEALVTGRVQTYEYMLKKQLGELNCSEMAVRFDKYQRQVLKKFVAEEKIDQLIEYLRNADVSGIISLIPDTEILQFIKFIGNDPTYYDPEYTECLIENTKKLSLLKTIADDFFMKDKLPTEVICFSPRTFDFEQVEQDIKWKQKDENSSSKFSNYNLYNDKLKYILFDILPDDHKLYKFDQIKLLCLLLVIANYDAPKGLINATHVYKAEIDFNSDIISKICEKYISKLRSTQALLKEIEYQVERDSETSLDDKTAQRLFESEVEIPVKIISDNKTGLFAVHKGIGLSTDCPEDEGVNWSRQYRNISKLFVRYLREPRRAIKSAVNEELRKNNFIDDDRSLLLSEDQTEAIQFHMAEIEQKMVETTTSHLFDTQKYTEQIQEADKEIKRGIGQRMTKRKTLFVGLFAVLAFFFGFIPLIFSSINTVDSFLLSLIVIGITTGIFLIIGFIYLFVLKKRLVNRFKHFNYVMSGVCSQITNTLVNFSQYLSCVCNLMRGFSSLKKRDSDLEKTKKILYYHNLKINGQIKNVHEMFSKYIDFNRINIKECEPYDFDFTLMCNYEYEMPSIHTNKKIDYLQPGNKIVIPIDYVESVTLTREELYD